jgi:hypothetical protein
LTTLTDFFVRCSFVNGDDGDVNELVLLDGLNTGDGDRERLNAIFLAGDFENAFPGVPWSNILVVNGDRDRDGGESSNEFCLAGLGRTGLFFTGALFIRDNSGLLYAVFFSVKVIWSYSCWNFLDSCTVLNCIPYAFSSGNNELLPFLHT